MKTLRAAEVVADAARGFQRDAVVPRCPTCREPCCLLQTLVLELDWRRMKGLWGLAETRREFDAALARGEGPPEIRTQEGRYYAYRRPCPAFDEGTRRCRVYGTPLKPTGCGDFPVYPEPGRLVADLRCEAVDAAAVADRLRAALGPGYRVRRRTDAEFPFLVYLTWHRVTSPPRPSGRRR